MSRAEIMDFKVQITENAWEKIHGWCLATKLECSGIGLVRKIGNIFTIYDAFLPDQICTGGHTTYTVDGLSKVITRIISSGRNVDEYRLWWHTHATFGCFWSGTDDDTARESVQRKDWMLSLVTNHDNKYLCRLDTSYPVPMTIDGIVMEWVKGPKVRWNNWKYQVAKHIAEPPDTEPTPGFGWRYDEGWDTDGDNWRRDGTRWIYDKKAEEEREKEETRIDCIRAAINGYELYGWCSKNLPDFQEWYNEMFEIWEQLVCDLWEEDNTEPVEEKKEEEIIREPIWPIGE